MLDLGLQFWTVETSEEVGLALTCHFKVTEERGIWLRKERDIASFSDMHGKDHEPLKSNELKS